MYGGGMGMGGGMGGGGMGGGGMGGGGMGGGGMGGGGMGGGGMGGRVPAGMVDEDFPFVCPPGVYGNSLDPVMQTRPQCAGPCPRGNFCPAGDVWGKRHMSRTKYWSWGFGSCSSKKTVTERPNAVPTGQESHYKV